MVSAGRAVCSKFRMCRMQAANFASGRRSGGPYCAICGGWQHRVLKRAVAAQSLQPAKKQQAAARQSVALIADGMAS